MRALAYQISRTGLLAPSRSTARSESAVRLTELVDEVRLHLLTSLSVRRGYEQALEELEQTRHEASVQGWNGYEARPMHLDAYINAKLFLQSMPSTAPFPEISADPDGDVSLDWSFAPGKALTVSISPTGRCAFAWMRGHRTHRGTEWFENGIPASITNALWELAAEITPETRTH